jgi:hypothetical protein
MIDSKLAFFLIYSIIEGIGAVFSVVVSERYRWQGCCSFRNCC